LQQEKIIQICHFSSFKKELRGDDQDAIPE